jgi:hypothetical protein
VYLELVDYVPQRTPVAVAAGERPAAG